MTHIIVAALAVICSCDGTPTCPNWQSETGKYWWTDNQAADIIKQNNVYSEGDFDLCCTACSNNPKCVAVTYVNDLKPPDTYDTYPGTCYLFSGGTKDWGACGRSSVPSKCSSSIHQHPAPPAPPPPPVPPPPPAPPVQPAWPTFTSQAELLSSPWAEYFKAVYGEVPTVGDPIKTIEFWMLYDSVFIKAHIEHIPESVGSCPQANHPLGQRYGINNQYQPRMVSFIWHPYPYGQLTPNSWVEVIHQADPFGDEHFGAWFMYTPGSGIYFNLGNTIAFPEHQDAYKHFSINHGDYNEELSKAAAAQGFDSIQFLAHVDHVNYQCDTKNTGISGLDYMGFEVLGVKLTGTYACTAESGAPGSIKTGWQGSKTCICDGKQTFLNCQGVPGLHALGLEDDLKAARHVESAVELQAVVV